MDNERFEYYDLWKCIYVYDSLTDSIIYYRDGAWHKEEQMSHHALEMEDMGLRIGRQWALEKTKGSTPEEFLDK